MQAWCGWAASTATAAGRRAGELVEVLSIRVHTTEEAAASELSEMNTRPAPVETHTVPVLPGFGERRIADTAPPRRVPPEAALVRVVAPRGAGGAKAPHARLGRQ